jgi:hypothetical protein
MIRWRQIVCHPLQGMTGEFEGYTTLFTEQVT